jgi:hypothetical protein
MADPVMNAVKAVQNGDITTVLSWVCNADNGKADIKSEETGKTLLHEAADAPGVYFQSIVKTHPDGSKTPVNRHELIGKWLIILGAKVSHADHNGWTSLHFAVRDDRKIEMMQMLLIAGVDVLSVTNDGLTAFDILTTSNTSAKDHPVYVDMVAILAAATKKAKDAKELIIAQQEAFAMGNHERLGVGSMVLCLDPNVVWMILESM